MVVLNVLGLNCGTSIDGIDVAHCRISHVSSSNDVTIEVLSYTEVAVDPSIRSQVLRLCRPNQESAATSMAEICDLNFALGREFSRAIMESRIDLEHVDVIASHGQTLWHQPSGENRSTLQMAEPAVLAQKTRRTVVSNFRVAELAAGRQGAPLAGFFEAGLLSDPEVTRISQNIGGMGNATVLVAQKKAKVKNGPANYLAFDTGPGNVFIDAAVRILSDGQQQYDCNGLLGSQGQSQIDEDFVASYLGGESYFQKRPPKTTGRELFSDDVAQELVEKLRARDLSPEGIIATITRITAESIAKAYRDFVLPLIADGSHIDEIYICGGGAHNPNILQHLQKKFPETRVAKLDDGPVQLAASAKEAVLFALLGFLCLSGQTVPLAVGSESQDPAVLGVITPGDNFRDIMNRVVSDKEFAGHGVLGRIRLVQASTST